MGHDISEKKEDTEKKYSKNHGGKQRMSNLSNFCFTGFLSLARAVHTHTHKTLYMDGMAFLTY
jgi:hypothetical protein